MLKVIKIVFCLITISACSSKDTLIPSDNKDIKDIFYQTNTHNNFVDNPQNRSNILHAKYYQLDNPTISLYVNTHLTVDEVPIPSYSTEFKMYEKDHVALDYERRK